MILLIDNYDSFSYNLYQLIGEIEPDVKVIRNDEMTVEEIGKLNPNRIILSPGPGRPEDAGIIVEAAKALGKDIPILGVCLGEQAIGEVFGAEIHNLPTVFHGIQSKVSIVADDYIFSDMPDNILVGRYHSWVVKQNKFPAELEVTALSEEGLVMALRHRTYDVHGIQFHPESILTPEGRRMIRNFITH